MQVVITITGKVTIADDDLKSVRAQNMEELATILHRYGKEIKTEVAVLLEPEQVEVVKVEGDSEVVTLSSIEKPATKKPSKKRRTRRAKKV